MKGVILIVGDKKVDSTKLMKEADKLGMKIEFVERVEKKITDLSERLYSISSMGYDVVFTIGGTGIEEDDITPEATEMVIDKKIPGLEYFIFSETVKSAISGMFVRIVAGLRKKTFIINLPYIGHERVFLKIIEAITELRTKKVEEEMVGEDER